MAIPGGEIGPNTSAQVCPDMVQPSQVSHHSYGTSWTVYGYIYPIYGILGSFWATMETPDGNSRWGNRSQHISPGVPWHVPILNKAQLQVWAHQRYWFGIFWFTSYFGLFLGGFEGPYHLKSDQIFKKKWAPRSTTIIIHFRKNNALWGIQKKLCPSVTTLAE